MSELTRREFQLGAGCLLAGGSIVAPLMSERGLAAERADPMAAPMCDFQTSFMTWHSRARKDPRPHARHNVPHGNMVRIQLDALIDVVDQKSGTSERFVLIAPCRTEWVYAEDRLFQIPSAYILEYPIKTMNFMPKTNSFQVDTGPILVPEYESNAKQPINRLEMAYVAYNRLDRAEFILRRPTPISDAQGKQLCQVLHYSKVREDDAKNVLLAATSVE